MLDALEYLSVCLPSESTDSTAGSQVPSCTVPQALADIRRGSAVLLVDDDSGEANLVTAAGSVTTEMMAFLVRHTSGLVCVAVAPEVAERLELPSMAGRGDGAVDYAVSVDASNGVTTGISADDRAATVRILGSTASTAADLSRPGHVLPVRVHGGGVLASPVPAEGAFDLVNLAGCGSAGLFATLLGADGELADSAFMLDFSLAQRIRVLRIRELVSWRLFREDWLTRAPGVQLPTSSGTFMAYGFESSLDTSEHIALTFGDLTARAAPAVFVHRECLAGDIFRSSQCRCGDRLHTSMRTITDAGCGLIIYLRAHHRGPLGLRHIDAPRGHLRDEFLAFKMMEALGIRGVHAAIDTFPSCA